MGGRGRRDLSGIRIKIKICIHIYIHTHTSMEKNRGAWSERLKRYKNPHHIVIAGSLDMQVRFLVYRDVFLMCS